MSKYLRNNIRFSYCALALLPGFDWHRLSGENQAEDFAENQFFNQEGDCEGEDHSGGDCDGCDCELHGFPPMNSLWLLLAATRDSHRYHLRLGNGGIGLRGIAEDFGNLGIALPANFYQVSHLNHAEE